MNTLLLLLVACSGARKTDTPDAGPPGCPTVAATEAVGALPDTIDEASGLGASRRHEGVLWAHNDSGDEARLFALHSDGSLRGEVKLEGVEATDWEDMAATSHDGASVLWVGDIGDNRSARDHVTVHRLEEPDPDASTAQAETLRLTYPDGAHDAETLLVDPVDGALYVVTKSLDGQTGLYRLPDAVQASGEATLEHVGTLRFGEGALAGATLVTAGDVSPDGAWVLLRTYTTAFTWWREADEPLHAAFAREPCPLEVVPEPQGEAIAFTADGGAYLTVSEGSTPPITRYTLESGD